jgi:hypothetical protein
MTTFIQNEASWEGNTPLNLQENEDTTRSYIFCTTVQSNALFMLFFYTQQLFLRIVYLF